MSKIVTLTMNPAVEISAEAPHVSPNRKIRCSQQHEEAGGGGINVARTLVRLGGEALALFPAGGSSGNRLPGILENQGVAHRMTPLGGWTRHNLHVRETQGQDEYFFVLPGPEFEENEWQACLDMVSRAQKEADLVVASGSLPPGVPTDFYARLARQLSKAGVKMLLDASGEALRKGVEEGVYLIKPNRRELGHLAGEEISDESHEEEIAHGLVEQGKCQALVLSLSAGGAKLFTNGDCRYFRAPTVKIKSTTGAGDSMLAAIALRLSEGNSLENAVRYGVAAGAAAV
ncbi:MAG: 1-phosphofructokinase family hexose kinase, partial [Desulfarculaceae bacterium]|nr:1-phosphofructokinase family hexose kinase [Desulfarculaceae bacterium]